MRGSQSPNIGLNGQQPLHDFLPFHFKAVVKVKYLLKSTHYWFSNIQHFWVTCSSCEMCTYHIGEERSLVSMISYLLNFKAVVKVKYLLKSTHYWFSNIQHFWVTCSSCEMCTYHIGEEWSLVSLCIRTFSQHCLLFTGKIMELEEASDGVTEWLCKLCGYASMFEHKSRVAFLITQLN